MKRLILFLVFATPILAQVSPPSTQSRVAGRFVAYNYGLWSLPIYQFPSGTGSKTFTLNSATVQLDATRQIMPFNTNAQITVGTETVTVTAVGPGCVVGATGTGICSITATFSNPHTASEPVKSATFGLQEALNDAGASGGGAVTVDSAWAGLGGTTGIINAATLPASTAIEDVRTSAGGGGSSGFPITIGSTSVAASSTTTSISGLTLVAPALGTPTALVLTNATALPAARVSSGALANGMTATTQSANDNSTKLATTAYVDSKSSGGAWTNITSAITPFNCTVSSGVCTITGASTSTVTIASIPAHQNLRIVIYGSAAALARVTMQINGDVGNHYWYGTSWFLSNGTGISGNSTNAGTSAEICSMALASAGTSQCTADFVQYANTNFVSKSAYGLTAGATDGTILTGQYQMDVKYTPSSAAAITSIAFTVVATTFTQNSTIQVFAQD